MKLTVGRGLDKIIFGMSEAKVIKALGKPDKTYTEEGERRIRYDEMRCGFWFDEDQLYWITCGNPKLSLFGNKLYGKTTEEVMSLLTSKLEDEPEHDDFGDWESHNFPDSWLELQFEYDTLKEVCFGHWFDDEDDPIWPDP